MDKQTECKFSELKSEKEVRTIIKQLFDLKLDSYYNIEKEEVNCLIGNSEKFKKFLEDVAIITFDFNDQNDVYYIKKNEII